MHPESVPVLSHRLVKIRTGLFERHSIAGVDATLRTMNFSRHCIKKKEFRTLAINPSPLASVYGVKTIEVGFEPTEYVDTEVSVPLLDARLNDCTDPD